MNYDTTAGMPTKSIEYAKLIEHLRLAAEASAMLKHLSADESTDLANGWFCVEELLKRLVTQVTQLATKGRLN